MTRTALILGVALATFAVQPLEAQQASFNFFVTSQPRTDGGNLRGLNGADQHCDFLAYARGYGDMNWRAYLSSPGDGDPVHARDRIGSGPWYNFNGVLIAEDSDHLHGPDHNLSAETALTERGERVPEDARAILTGSDTEGRLFEGDSDATCQGWSSNDSGGARVGHLGDQNEGESWNSAHTTSGCAPEDLGGGLMYCFGGG